VERRRRVALYLIGELGAEDLAPLVLSALDGEDPDLALRAAGVLAKLSSRKGDEVLRGWLDPATAASPQDAERRIRAALPVVLEAETPEAYRDARPLLDHPRISVRSTLATLLAQHMDAYGREVGEDLIGGAPVRVVSDRARRTLLDALARAKTPPLPMVFLGVVSKLDHEDWGVRADAARVLRHWADLEGIDAVTKETAVDALTLLLQDEKDSFVRFAAGEDR
jgi:HEAT repeat protein